MAQTFGRSQWTMRINPIINRVPQLSCLFISNKRSSRNGQEPIAGCCCVQRTPSHSSFSQKNLPVRKLRRLLPLLAPLFFLLQPLPTTASWFTPTSPAGPGGGGHAENLVSPGEHRNMEMDHHAGGAEGHSSRSEGSVSVASSLQLQCPPCERIHCSPRRARRLRCAGGVTRGVCNCCPVCAKTRGQQCGGQLGYLGRCDRALVCTPLEEVIRETDADGDGQEYRYYRRLLEQHGGGSSGVGAGRGGQRQQQEVQQGEFTQGPYKYFVGICQPVPHRLLDQGMIPGYCEPKCTPKFCKANRRAICAAHDNVISRQECQGACQHTSCSACRYVHDEPSCVKCRKDEFTCMKKFAKCVKKTYCTRQKYPCKQVGELEEGLKFKCLVPDCLTT